MRVFPVVRTLLYVCVFVAAWVWAILLVRRVDVIWGLRLPPWLSPLGYLLLVPGLVLLAVCVVLFALRGRGTPAPFDAPRELVVTGPYRYVRNPIYVGLVTSVVGLGLVLGSVAVMLLAMAAWAVSHAAVILYEEPTLRRRFGESYERYTRDVNRWMPRVPRRRQ